MRAHIHCSPAKTTAFCIVCFEYLLQQLSLVTCWSRIGILHWPPPPLRCTFVMTATDLAPPKFYRNYCDCKMPCVACLKDLPMRTWGDLLDTAVKSELWWLRLMLQLSHCCPLSEQSHILHGWMHMKNSTSFDVDLISLKVEFVALNLKVALGLVPL